MIEDRWTDEDGMAPELRDLMTLANEYACRFASQAMFREMVKAGPFERALGPGWDEEVELAWSKATRRRDKGAAWAAEMRQAADSLGWPAGQPGRSQRTLFEVLLGIADAAQARFDRDGVYATGWFSASLRQLSEGTTLSKPTVIAARDVMLKRGWVDTCRSLPHAPSLWRLRDLRQDLPEGHVLTTTPVSCVDAKSGGQVLAARGYAASECHPLWSRRGLGQGPRAAWRALRDAEAPCSASDVGKASSMSERAARRALKVLEEADLAWADRRKRPALWWAVDQDLDAVAQRIDVGDWRTARQALHQREREGYAAWRREQARRRLLHLQHPDEGAGRARKGLVPEPALHGARGRDAPSEPCCP